MTEGLTQSPTVDIERVARLVAPLERLAAPLFVGMDNIPEDRPLLFVGNHTIYGLFDVPFMYLGLHRQRGIFLRALGDHIHFKVPLWSDLLARCGVVDGTRENCGALMQAGECVLVFPGGAREVAKRKGERYTLVWKERLGFVRMAVRHGCSIVPFSALGADDAFDILLDADDLMRSPLGRLLAKLGIRSDVMLPIARGLGPTPIPRPERLYFRFGAPVETRSLAGQESDSEACRAVRAQVSAEIEAGLAELMEFRETDPDRALLPRLRAALDMTPT